MSDTIDFPSKPATEQQSPGLPQIQTAYLGPGTSATANSASGAGTVATTLPGSPTDGQTVILTDSTSAPTYAWEMQYLAAASKWVFIGGSPLAASVATLESTSSATYADLATAGPSVTVPRAGSYKIEIHANMSNSSTLAVNHVAAKLGAAASADTESVAVIEANGGTSGDHEVMHRAIPTRTLAASDVVKLQYKASSGTGYFMQRELLVTPIFLT